MRNRNFRLAGGIAGVSALALLIGVATWGNAIAGVSAMATTSSTEEADIAAMVDVLREAEASASNAVDDQSAAAFEAANEAIHAASPPVALDGVTNAVSVASEAGMLRIAVPGVAATDTPPVGVRAAAKSGSLLGVSTAAGGSVTTYDTESGFQSLISIESVAAPTQYAFSLTLPVESIMTIQKDGSVTIEDAEGLISGSFEAPWATDASGKQVPTHFEVQGTNLVQVIDHGSTSEYPIVADPSGVWGWTVCVATVAAVLAGNANLALKVATVVKRFGTLKRTLQIAYKAYKQAASSKKQQAIINAIGAVGGELFGINQIKSKCFS